KRGPPPELVAAQRAPKSPPQRFEIRYNPSSLIQVGPLVLATCSVPPAVAEGLVNAGKEVPPPVRGRMLIDTGATRTCIAADVAEELLLVQTGVGETYGAGGLHRLPVYGVKIEIHFSAAPGAFTLGSVRPVLAIPDFCKAFDPDKLQVTDGWPTRSLGLLGREFLANVVMNYDGHSGVIQIRAAK
ncbi:MAG: hypothetical protein ACOY3Y_03905, partial [Acidobacteriota bacterium]